jgi:hydrogenase maturation protease
VEAAVADPIRAIADAVLYEGYILWPYRRSALKNQRRFTFGGVFPPAHSRRHPDDRSSMQTQVLVRGPLSPDLEITVRFLHVVQRTVLDERGEPVDERVVDGERFVSWEEAVERSMTAPGVIAIGSGSERDGFIVRSWEELRGELSIALDSIGDDLTRVTVVVRNTTPFPDGGACENALKRTFCSTHILLRIAGDARSAGSAFVSATDPPPELIGALAECSNVGCWPVLVEPTRPELTTHSDEGDVADSRYGTTMLASPIILEDHPRIAPESPGDLFDGGEIDQLLVLNILAMTEEEKDEMAASDPRAREILERTEALTPEQLMALHGRTVLR